MRWHRILCTGMFLASLITVAALQVSCKGSGSTGSAAGLTQSDLPKASPTLAGRWEQYNRILANDKSGWQGSTVVYKKKNGKLLLFTNSHCLNLSQLAYETATFTGSPEVVDYALQVTFASGVTSPVERFAETPENIDIALLEVDEGALEEGKDYILVGSGANMRVEPGDDVVTVGTPLGYTSTLTFGKVSAIREMNGVKQIQTDAAINHGNSGGPLFLRRDGRFHWIGINTSRVDDGQGLGFAIWLGEIGTQSFRWYACDKEGAAQAIRQIYKKGAVPK